MYNLIKNMNCKIKKVVTYSLIFFSLLCIYYAFVYVYFSSDSTKVLIKFVTYTPAVFQAFYDTQNPEEMFAEESSIFFTVEGKGELEEINLDIPLRDITRLRLDFGEAEKQTILVKSIEIGSWGRKIELHPDEMICAIPNQVELFIKDDFLGVITAGNDPYVFFDGLNVPPIEPNILYGVSLFLSLVTTIILYRFVHLHSVYNLVTALYSDRRLIFSLAKNDFKTRYAGSYFGIIWAFIHPIMTILIFWFVFQVGFRAAPVKNIPFILWFMSGLIPWFFFAEAWNTATNCFVEYSYLVRKVSFRISILPMVKVLSSLFVHIVFVIFMIVAFMFSGFLPNIKILQLAYFSLSMTILVIALSFITSSIVVFFKDLSQILSIVLQFGMWLTPIMWSIDMIPQKYVWIFKLNPMYYIISGFRDTMINQTWFFLNIKQTFYFWLITGTLFFVGAFLYKKTRPHFADVL